MPPVGLLTESPEYAELPWAKLSGFQVSGWDIAGNAHRAAEDLARVGVLPRDLVDLCGDLRDRLELSMAPGIPDRLDVELAQEASRDRALLKPAQAVEALRQDIRQWQRESNLRRAAVVHLATAERCKSLSDAWQDEAADPLELLQEQSQEISLGLLYGIAAVAEGLPFINFTPAVGPGVPALQGMARRKGVPLLGNDGKTGETLMKSVLAPMFRDRALRVMAWQGYNMLGNKDGAALVEPERRTEKLANKDAVIQNVLGDAPIHTKVGIDFVPSLHDWKTAWDFIHFEGFLGARMSLQFTWQGSDSALAAPLVLDLARIALLAQDRGHAGPLTAAAPFFKNPIGTQEADFHRQMTALRSWLAG